MAVPTSLATRGARSAARTLALLLSLTAGGLAACGGGGGGDPAPVVPAAVASLDGSALSGVVGTELAAPVRVRVTDASGKAARSIAIVWSPSDRGTVSSATSTTNADGVAEVRWTLGPTVGAQSLTVTAQGSAGSAVGTSIGASATADKPASVQLTGDSVLLMLPGSTFPVTARVVDRFGNVATSAAAVQWSTSDPAIATVDAAGVVTGRAAGRVTLQAVADAARGQTAVVVMAPMSLGKAGPDSLVPGATVTIDGSGFPTQPGALSVAVSGATAAVTSVTATRITATVPAQTALPCEPPSAGRVTVRRHLAGAIDSSVVPVRVDASVTRSLAVGESVTMADGVGAGCVRLDRGGRYLVSVFNTGSTVVSSSSVRLRGAVAATTAADPSAAASRLAPAPAYRMVAPAPRALSAEERAERDAEVEHGRHLEQERSIVAALGSPLPGLEAAAAARKRAPGVRASVATVAPPNVGDTVSLTAMYSSCARGTAIRARVVYVGSKSVVYEDVQSPRAGEMDSELRRVGEEFDTVQLPILEQYFASPLAMDAKLDNDGKIAMLFTKFVNDSLPGVIGYITSCNFYAPAQAPASNQRELFYARAPRVGESAATWRYNLRSTVIHEVKHLGSYAERFLKANGATPVFEETWMEEGTARLAEEFYARTFSAATWKGNATYQPTLACEVVACAGDDRPKMMLKHYEVLADYYSRIGSLTPLGGVTGADNTFYASGWLLVRWAIDHYASDEASFIHALVTETGATGLANLSRRTGRPASEMLADWSLALAADDRPGLTPRRTQLALPSWNTRDVFRGLNSANSVGFPRQFPLLVQQVKWGAFTVDVPIVRSWSAAFFEVAGTAADGPELLELKGGNGSSLSSQIGMAVLRIE